MKEVVIKSFEDLQDIFFKNCFDEGTKRYRNNFVYRGISDISYPLITSLNRVCAHDLTLENSIVRNFMKYGFADVNNISSFWQIIATGQHFGLPTRLLDWTYSPLVAAHFVTAKIQDYDKDGVIYCVDIEDSLMSLPQPLKDLLLESRASSFTISMLEKCARNFDELASLSDKPFFLFYEPASTNDRMANQYALFSCVSDPHYTIQELLEKYENNSLYRIIIPKECKLEIRDKLDYINISERVIYPGLDGICSWITRRYYDLSQYSGKKND